MFKYKYSVISLVAPQTPATYTDAIMTTHHSNVFGKHARLSVWKWWNESLQLEIVLPLCAKLISEKKIVA